MQVLEPPSGVQVTYDPQTKGHYARGFLISTKRTLPAPEGEFQISRETGHDMVKSFMGEHFMIDSQLLENQDDGHFYGHGLQALLEGYRKKSHGQLQKLYGPFYYNDGTKDYWYEYGMRLRDSGAAAALAQYGANSWQPFAVSPHIWDYPELGQDNLNLKKWKGVGVALVMKGAFGPQAVITRLCKGSSDTCYSDKGLGATLSQKCEAGCACDICKMEDTHLANLVTSYIGKSGFDSSRTLDNPNNPNNPMDGKQQILANNPTIDPQIAATQGYVKADEFEKIKSELEQAKLNAKAEAEKEWKAEVDQLKDEAKSKALDEIFKAHVTEEPVLAALKEKYMKLDLKEVKNLKGVIDDYNQHVVPSIKKQLKAEVEKPNGDGTEPPNGDNGEDQAKNAKGKGKAGTSLPAEPNKDTPTHELPKDDNNNNKETKGKAASSKNELQEVRGLMEMNW